MNLCIMLPLCILSVCISFQAEKRKWKKALKNSEEVNLLL